jgi:large repetitive protein
MKLRMPVSVALALTAAISVWEGPVARADGVALPPVASLAALGEILVFGADDGKHGWELWRSDGTPAGTRLIKDIRPGRKGSLPAEIWEYDQATTIGETLYFRADDGEHGHELWRTDGTPDGTVLVKDIRPGREGSGRYTDGLRVVDDRLYFRADDGVHGSEVWRSDGTSEGTILLQDLQPGPKDSMFGWADQLTNVAGTLYFFAADGLWRSDGTASGTTLVMDGLSETLGMTAVGGTLYFLLDDGLWRTDGTTEGTIPVTADGGTVPLDVSCCPVAFGLNSDDSATLYLQAGDVDHGDELWRASSRATSLVKDIRPGPSDSSPTGLVVMGEIAFFGATDGELGSELWRSDGTAAGTVLVKDIRPGSKGSGPSDLTAIGESIYFPADDGEHGYELWRTDGTSAGTSLVKDIRPGRNGSDLYVGEFLGAGDILFFNADDGRHGHELWRSDGTAAGTRLIKDIRRGSLGIGPIFMFHVDDTLYFSVVTRRCAGELWRSDGTPEGTVRLLRTDPDRGMRRFYRTC